MGKSSKLPLNTLILPPVNNQWEKDKITAYREVRCELCSRNGLISVPRIIGDILNVSIMLVGQNPGFSDHGIPDTHVACFGYNFTCEFIDDIIQGFDDLYITNIVKCATKKALNKEAIIECVDNFLVKEIVFIEPKVIICLGREAEHVIEAAQLALKDDIQFDVEYITHPGSLKRNNASDVEILGVKNQCKKIMHYYRQNSAYKRKG
jgi:uracil-DNA glycosylase family 4